MQQLVVWAHSDCRSTMAFYRGLAVAFGVPLEVFCLREGSDLRAQVGFSHDEFADMNPRYIKDFAEADAILRHRRQCHHLFGAYQNLPLYQRVMLQAKAYGCHVGIASEAPCNMDSGAKRWLKQCYIDYVLPLKLKPYIRCADFIINYSGADSKSLERVGWNITQIIPCGYYSPPIPGSHAVLRTEQHQQHFSVLLTGLHTPHRSPMLLLRALHLLQQRGITCPCYITQEGPLLPQMKRFAQRHHLDKVQFLGRVPLTELITLYQQCSVMVGAGNHEPWGIRLNDALLCGAPLLVNRGMGCSMLVDRYGCGACFAQDDVAALADTLQRMMIDSSYYLAMAQRAYHAAAEATPERLSRSIAQYIQLHFPNWSSDRG